MAAILGGYPKAVVDRVTDPRTGIAQELKFLPSVAEIREACDVIGRKIELMAKPRPIPVPYVPPPILPGQVDSKRFAELVAQGKAHPRPVGRFEQKGDRWNK